MSGTKLFKYTTLGMMGVLTEACRQIEILKIENMGVITDYLTPQDEIFAWFGVGSYVLYEYEHKFRRNDSVTIPFGQVYMPCFKDEQFFLEIMELDEL